MRKFLSSQLRASVTVFVLIMLGLIIGLYLVGYKAPAVDFIATTLIGSDGTMDQQISALDILNLIKNAILSPFGLASIVIIGLFTLIGSFFKPMTGGITSALVAYLVPVAILFAVANIFFFPVIPYIGPEGLPLEMTLFLQLIFNTLLLLTVISFISGRD